MYVKITASIKKNDEKNIGHIFNVNNSVGRLLVKSRNSKDIDKVYQQNQMIKFISKIQNTIQPIKKQEDSNAVVYEDSRCFHINMKS